MTLSNSANSLSERDRASLFHPTTDLDAHERQGPLTIVRGEGVRVEDEDGQSYIEAVSGLWSVSLGFRQKRLADAAYRQLMELPSYHLFRHISHPRAIELAEKMLAIAPVPMSKVFFANSGSEANDTAVKLVWYYNNALTGREEEDRRPEARVSWRHHRVGQPDRASPQPHRFRSADARLFAYRLPELLPVWLPGESEEEFSTRLAAKLEALIEREGPETIAAFIAEPFMGVGGVMFRRRGISRRSRDVLALRYPARRGRGHLRLRPAGPYVRQRTLRHESGHPACAKGLSSGYLPISAVMIDKVIWELRTAKRQDRRVRARLHLRRPPGLRRRRA